MTSLTMTGAIFVLLLGCASSPPGKTPTPSPRLSSIQTKIVRVETTAAPKRNHMPITYNKQVEKWINHFNVKDRARFQRYLDRGAKIKPYIQSVLKENGLPLELYYLAMIESGFVNHARSRANAVGPWQFMKPTARDYGLTVNYLEDQRRDPIRATESAAAFLRDLYDTLGSWPLALAAYNSGESRVRRAIRRAKTRDFWKISKKRILPRETRNYVPQFLAATIIGENLNDFGFRKSTVTRRNIAEVTVPTGVSFKSISRFTGIPYSTLKNLNPHLVRKITPTRGQKYKLWAPVSYKSKFATAFSTLSKHKTKPRQTREPSSNSKHHIVRRGQTLSQIAQRYSVSISYLKRVNKLNSSRIYPRQKIIVSAPKLGKTRFHTVQRGQTLSEIAYRYGKSVSSIKRLNNLENNKIFAGQKLRVRSSSYSGQPSFHKVRAGENLSVIAKKFGVKVSTIQQMNKLGSSKIFIGQRLLIPAQNKLKKSTRYRVRRGDNLTKIAQKFGVSLKKLKKQNSLRGSRIVVGQLLSINP